MFYGGGFLGWSFNWDWYFGACAYVGCLIYHYGWDAFDDPAPWVCGAVAVGVA